MITRHMRVLLVDDEEIFRDVIEKRLEMRGVVVSSVSSALEAFEYLQKNVVDIVVLDVRMPGIDGITALRQIKKKHPDIEIIMLTGHASVEAAVDGMKAGAFDYLTKPIEFDDLFYKLQDAYERRLLASRKVDHEKVKK